MSFVVSKDMGKGNPPAFFGGAYTWTVLANAKQFACESDAQDIDNGEFLAGCIVMPNDETLMTATNEKSAHVLSGMKPDTQQND